MSRFTLTLNPRVPYVQGAAAQEEAERLAREVAAERANVAGALAALQAERARLAALAEAERVRLQKQVRRRDRRWICRGYLPSSGSGASAELGFMEDPACGCHGCWQQASYSTAPQFSTCYIMPIAAWRRRSSWARPSGSSRTRARRSGTPCACSRPAAAPATSSPTPSRGAPTG